MQKKASRGARKECFLQAVLGGMGSSWGLHRECHLWLSQPQDGHCADGMGGVAKTNSSRSLITCGAAVVEHQLLALCSSGTWGWAEPLAPSPAMGRLSAALGISVRLLFLASLLPHTRLFAASNYLWSVMLDHPSRQTRHVNWRMEELSNLHAWDSGGSRLTLAPGTMPRATNPSVPI